MSQNVRKWLIILAKIYLQAKIWIILPLHSLENLSKYISALHCQNHKLHFQPFLDQGVLLFKVDCKDRKIMNRFL